MALEKWKQSEVIRILDETENTKRFTLRIPEVEKFEFKPGQFITLDLPVHEKKTKRWRSYSVASPPTDQNEFELVISHVPGGLATTYFWEKVIPGTTIPIRGPLGNFFLPPNIETELCLVCTGTGIAPYRSMLLDLIRYPRPHKAIHLIFGTRYLKDILYHGEMEKMASQIPGFHYQLILSRENSPSYTGRIGYVHTVYEELFAHKQPAQFYLCGWQNMIDEARIRIEQMGYDHSAVHVELYG